MVVEALTRSGSGFRGGRCRDLSTTGLQLVTGLTLAPGMDVRVKLKAPPRMVAVEGRVVWASDFACDDPDHLTAGIRFVRIDPDDRAHLDAYLFSLAEAVSADAANDGQYDATR